MKNSGSGWRIVALACLGLMCFYIGWADWLTVKPEFDRAQLQHAIRDTVRLVFQVLVQWIVPFFCMVMIAKLVFRK